jgi:MFS transporter, PAT family, beta-lactamase induction signal transducer AmpG
LILLPHTPSTFALALIGENVFQAVAITASTAIAFETIGPSNPLASTNYCLMLSAFNIANTYMLVVDGWGYSRHGVAGGYAADATLSLAASLLLAALLIWLSRRRKAASMRRAIFSS